MIVSVLDGIGLALAVVLVLALVLIARRRLLQRGGGTFDCSLRLHPASSLIPARLRGGGAHRSGGRGWALGIARYSGDVLEWFRVFSLAPSPRRVFAREDVVVRSRRSPLPSEETTLYAGHVVVECQVDGDLVELAMAEDALTGFLAWLEAAPPGREAYRGLA